MRTPEFLHVVVVDMILRVVVADDGDVDIIDTLVLDPQPLHSSKKKLLYHPPPCSLLENEALTYLDGSLNTCSKARLSCSWQTRPA